MKKWDKWMTLAPIALVLAFLPLVVGRINSKTYTENEPWLPANAVESDFFLYGKLFVLFFCCLFMIVILARMRFWRQIHEMPKYLLLLILYGGFAIASSLHANHLFLSVRGMTGNMQGLFVILSYLVVFFYSFFWVKKTGNISILIKILGVSIGILGVIGVSQFFGFDLLSMGFVKEFLGGRKARVSHFIYLTLYHWNYVGSYVALLLPVTVAMIVYFHEAGKKRERTFWFVLFYLLIFCLFGSQSRTGTLAVLVSFCIGGVKYRNKVCQYKRTILCVFVSVLAILFFCNWYITGDIFGKWQQVRFSTKGSKKLSYIETKDNHVKIRYKKKNYSFVIEGSGENITLKKTPDRKWKAFSFEKKAFGDGEKTIYGYEMKYKKSVWRFTNQRGDGKYYYLNASGKWDLCIHAETALPSWMNEVASLRGFVWSRTIPLLKDYVLLGAGPDQFGFVFPHNDYVARYQYDLLTTYYKKPHNYYLQMGIETGCLSLVLMLAFFVIFLKRGFAAAKGKCHTQKEYFIRAILISVLGYLFAGMFNDSMVVTAPVFWCLLGMGVGGVDNRVRNTIKLDLPKKGKPQTSEKHNS